MEESNMITITVVIAGRPYPLRVNAEEEAAIRKIVKEVNDKVNHFQMTYTDRDKQDCLSMVALTYAVESFKMQQQVSSEVPTGVAYRLTELDQLLEKLLH